MSINAVAALSLRKPDVKNSMISSNVSESGASRFGKRSNMKEILVRNFFRKYPLQGNITDTQQLQIERHVASEMDTFVTSNQQINSKNLHQFELKLAQDVQLSKRQVDALSPAAQGKRNMGGSGSNNRNSSQRQDFLRRNPNDAVNGQFQLPSINSHAALVSKNKSIENIPRNSLRGLHDSSNRRSHAQA